MIEIILVALIISVSYMYYMYYTLYSKYTYVCNENSKLKIKNHELNLYKSDVSKTFKILDSELELINNHIKKSDGNSPIQIQHDLVSNNVTSLTPDMLSSLFENVNQEHFGNTNQAVNNNSNSNNEKTSEDKCNENMEAKTENIDDKIKEHDFSNEYDMDYKRYLI